MLLQLTSSVDLAQVGKTPDVSEPHSKADTSQQVLDLVVPFGSLLRICFGHPHLGKKKTNKKQKRLNSDPALSTKILSK